MPRPYSSKAIANFFIKKAKDNDVSLSPMKLQKLVYFAYGWNLAINDDELINENIEAWKFGPVISSLYHDTKIYGSNSVKEYLTDFDFNNFTYRVIKVDEDDTETLDVLDQVWKVYSGHSAMQLSNMTHRKGTPWDETYKPDIAQNTPIEDKIIKEYFTNMANQQN